MHGCPLVVAVPLDSSIVEVNSPAVKTTIEVLSSMRNFTILRKYNEYNLGNDVLFAFDFMEQIGQTGLTVASSVPIWFGTVDFIIPPGEPFDQLDKMFMMFDYYVWLAIAITLLTVVGTALITNWMSKSIKTLLFGSNVSSPALNLMSTFLVGGQNQLPHKSSSRFLLLLFIVFSLIIRTFHQSLLFQYMEADLRKPRIQSVEELEEKNFTYVGRMPFSKR